MDGWMGVNEGGLGGQETRGRRGGGVEGRWRGVQGMTIGWMDG